MYRSGGNHASNRGARQRPDRNVGRPLALPVLTLLLAGAALLGGSLAQDDLYGPEAPRDAAYIRFVNADPDTELMPIVDGEALVALPFTHVSPYHLVAPGERTVEVTGEALELELLPESFTTVVALPEEKLVLDDAPLRDVSRGLLTFYNLTEETLTLLTADGNVVFEDVSARTAASVAISEAEAQLVVQGTGGALAELESRLYRRGEAHAVFVLLQGGEPLAVYVRAGAEP